MIAPDKRKALFLLHQEGLSIRQIARQLAVSRRTVRQAIAQQGAPPRRAFVPPLDPELVRGLYEQCDGYVQRVWEKLREEHGLDVKYSTLTRWLRQLGISLPPAPRCERVPDEPGAEMQHDTSPFTIPLARVPTKLQASLLYLRYSKRRYLQFYRVFDRFRMKCFLHRALVHWGHAPGVCVIDNTHLARLRGLGSQAVMVPEMEAFAKAYGFRFLCHAPRHSDRKAGEERSFSTVETNFLPGRTFANLEDLNRQALEWSTVRMEQRPQGKAGLIPAQAFEHERGFLQALPPYLPAPYVVLERSVDEYGYVAVEANYYWVPGTGRGRLKVLRYENHLQIYQEGQVAIEYPLAPGGVRNQQIDPPGKPASQAHPRHRPQPSNEEEKRLRALAPTVSAYVDFLQATPGHLRHQTLRRLWALSQHMSPELFARSVARAHRYRVSDLKTLERIAHLYLQETPGQLPLPAIDESFRDRPAYQEGALTDSPNLALDDE
jgi:transposase